VAASAKEVEAAGYSGAWTAETAHDPFFPLLLAAEHTSEIEVGTSIAVAFARNPMTLANIGWDLQSFSNGRFVLGLGSQIKPHITKRFSMEWSHPAARMREMVLAIRAIWDTWLNGTKLDFRGDFYTHTLMTPFFDPGPNPHGLPPILLAGVGPLMTEVAGEVADGVLVHPLNTPAFVAEDLLPALTRGSARAGRAVDSVTVSCQLIVATGLDSSERERNFAQARAQVAFYASTPAYRPVLERHGMGDLQPRLNALSKQGKWPEMAALVSEELLREVVVRGEPEEAGAAIRARCAGWCARVSPVVYSGSMELQARLLAGIRGT
jgi:probable F420-dependent oxidoreductase